MRLRPARRPQRGAHRLHYFVLRSLLPVSALCTMGPYDHHASALFGVQSPDSRLNSSADTRTTTGALRLARPGRRQRRPPRRSRRYPRRPSRPRLRARPRRSPLRGLPRVSPTAAVRGAPVAAARVPPAAPPPPARLPPAAGPAGAPPRLVSGQGRFRNIPRRVQRRAGRKDYNNPPPASSSSCRPANYRSRGRAPNERPRR